MSAYARAPSGLMRGALGTLGVAIGTMAIAGVSGLALVRVGTVDNQLKPILLGIAIVGIAVAAVRPRFGFLLLVALLPFQYRIRAAGLLVGTNELLLIGLALVMGPRIEWAAIPRWMVYGSSALILGSFASVVLASDPGAAAWGAVRWSTVIVLAWAAFGVFGDDERAQQRFVDLLCGAAMLVVLFAILQRVGINAVAGKPYFPDLPDSTFGYYTVYAGFIALVATLAVGELLTAMASGQPGRVTLYGVAIAVCIVGIGVSLSRGGLLALSAGLIALTMLQLSRGSVALKLAVVLVASAGIGYAATPRDARDQFQARFEGQRQGQEQDDRIRFAYQKAGFTALVHSPLGIGYGNFSDYVGRNAVNSQTKDQAFHSHNTFVQAGIEAGWIGLVGFLLLIGVPLLRALRLSAKRMLSPRTAAFAAALVGVLSQGLFDYLFHEIAILAFFVALIWALARLLERDAADVPQAA
ncbi:MAG: O-antigen ligase family protein [Solirubrobacteraceae bacterium]